MAKKDTDGLTPQKSELALLKYLDGEANPADARAIEASDELMERSHQLADEQKIWSRALYRIECPSSIKLGEYNLQLLPHSEKSEIKLHVSNCPHCTSELTDMKSFMGEAPQHKLREILETGKRLVAELVEVPTGTPAMQTRGLGFGTRVYIAGDLQFSLSAQPDPSDSNLKSIIGLASGEKADGMVAHLVFEGSSIQISELDDFGNFRFARLDTGVFDVFLRGEDITVEIGSFKV